MKKLEVLENDNLDIYINQLCNIAKSNNLSFDLSWSVFPSDEKYSVSFMWKVPDEIYNINIDNIVSANWNDYILYNGKKVLFTNYIRNELRLALATRLDNFNNSGRSNRHSTTFMMLWFEWIMTKEEWILLILNFLKDFLWNLDYKIWINIHPDDKISNKYLWNYKDIDISFDDSCYFDWSDKWNDRKWKRLEFNISFDDDEWKTHSWEIINMVFIEKIWDIDLPTPIIEWWWSFERLIAIKEKKWNIHDLSIYDDLNSLLKNNFKEEEDVYWVIDMIKTLVNMSLSWFDVKVQSKQSRAFKQWLNDFAHFLSLNWIKDQNIIKLLLKIKIKFLQKFYHNKLDNTSFKKPLNYIFNFFENIDLIEVYIEFINKPFKSVKKWKKNQNLIDEEEDFKQKIISNLELYNTCLVLLSNVHSISSYKILDVIYSRNWININNLEGVFNDILIDYKLYYSHKWYTYNSLKELWFLWDKNRFDNFIYISDNDVINKIKNINILKEFWWAKNFIKRRKKFKNKKK